MSENPNFGWFVPRSGSLVTEGGGKIISFTSLTSNWYGSNLLTLKTGWSNRNKNNFLKKLVSNFLCQIQVANDLS